MKLIKILTPPEQSQIIASHATWHSHLACIALLLMVTFTWTSAQAQPAEKPNPHENGNVVNATYSDNTYGAELTLPDGSVIKSVWPAALNVIDVANPWRTQPATPRCEPAVYSIARVLSDGKELWAKSYLLRGPIIDACDPDKWGFAVRSGLYEYGGFLNPDDLIYLTPYDGTFFIGRIANEFVRNTKPPEHGLRINADTGEVVGQVPSDLRAIDAYQLRKMKAELWAEIESQYPVLQYTELKNFRSRAAYDTEANWRERLRYRAQFKRLEALILKIPKSTNNPKQ